MLFAAALVAGVLKYLWAHNRKHGQIDRRLTWGNDAFEKNNEDHDEIKQVLVKEQQKSSAAIHGIRELLVHFKIRKPGESINGEDE